MFSSAAHLHAASHCNIFGALGAVCLRVYAACAGAAAANGRDCVASCPRKPTHCCCIGGSDASCMRPCMHMQRCCSQLFCTACCLVISRARSQCSTMLSSSVYPCVHVCDPQTTSGLSNPCTAATPFPQRCGCGCALMLLQPEARANWRGGCQWCVCTRFTVYQRSMTINDATMQGWMPCVWSMAGVHVILGSCCQAWSGLST